MPGSSIPGYVARYGDALKRLNGPQPSVGALGTALSSRVYDPSLSPGTGALGMEAAQGIDNGIGMAQPTMAASPMSTGPTPSAIGALAPATPKAGALTPAQRRARSFWDIAKDLSPEERADITKSFEDKGVDVPAAYEKLKKEGKVAQDPGFVKRNEDGSIDKKDMGMFLLESGLKQMQAAGQPGANALTSMAEGTLSTIESRRGRAATAAATEESSRRFDAERADKSADRAVKAGETTAQKEIAANREKGETTRGEADRASREKIAGMEAVSRMRAARMVHGDDNETVTDETTGEVFWKKTGEPVMVKGKDGPKPLTGKTNADKGEVNDKDLLAAGEKHRAALDGNPISSVTIDGETVRWSQASDEQKNEYLASYKKNLKSQSGKKTPDAPSGNVFDQFD